MNMCYYKNLTPFSSLQVVTVYLDSHENKWNYECNGKVSKTQDGYVRFHNVVRFPYGGPFMGLFLAIAVPLELPKTNVFVSYNFEANYNLPDNITTYEYPPIVSDRSLGINRKSAYDALEYKINSHGYPGKACLLRAICEAAEYTLEYNGVLGDILRILLAPSASKNENLPVEYGVAEKYGKFKKNCRKYIKKCSISILEAISWLGETI